MASNEMKIDLGKELKDKNGIKDEVIKRKKRTKTPRGEQEKAPTFSIVPLEEQEILLKSIEILPPLLTNSYRGSMSPRKSLNLNKLQDEIEIEDSVDSPPETRISISSRDIGDYYILGFILTIRTSVKT